MQATGGKRSFHEVYGEDEVITFSDQHGNNICTTIFEGITKARKLNKHQKLKQQVKLARDKIRELTEENKSLINQNFTLNKLNWNLMGQDQQVSERAQYIDLTLDENVMLRARVEELEEKNTKLSDLLSVTIDLID